jgi:hypothetical protein
MTRTPKEKKDPPIASRLELLTTENGSGASEMDMVSSNGQMELDMKVIGRITGLMARANSSTSMAISTTEIG